MNSVNMNMKTPLSGQKRGAARLDRNQLPLEFGPPLRVVLQNDPSGVAAMPGCQIPEVLPVIAEVVRKARLRKIRDERDRARRLELKLY